MTNPRHPRAPVWQRALASLLSLAIALPAGAATALTNQPISSNISVPGNLALPLSVEFPTAISVAHVDNTYVASTEYLGYFDPNKCYLYKTYTVETATDKDHFYPAALADASHTCVGAKDQMWSGNFLNWATMQTIDPFRWALTGGYRVVDTPSLTLLEKAYATTQGSDSNFPDRTVATAATVEAATPFTTSLVSRVKSMGDRMLLSPNGVTSGLLATYFNNKELTGTPVLTRFETVDFNWGRNSPGTGVSTNDFSVRWTVTSVAPSDGDYTFQTIADDGVVLYVNGVKVIDKWSHRGGSITTNSAAITLKAGDTIKITLEYCDDSGNASIELKWSRDGTSLGTYVPSPDALNATTPPYPQMAVRVKVCDPNVGLESNCVAYQNGNYKPEGLMQKYAQQIRYSVFGYINNDSGDDASLKRDGGVLRAQQKFVGPTYPVPGSSDATNTATEWSATTGVFTSNPDNITSAMGQPISDSGVLNYVNKFGEVLRGSYKTYDPVGELYYAALRYYRNLGNVPEWTALGATDAINKKWADGFPVITAWNDPILYSCQRNFILGIGDVNTHADKNVPGGTSTTKEPTMPASVADDTSVDAVDFTNRVGVMQGIGGGSLGTVENYNGCCNNNAALMAGLAYDANVNDIRSGDSATTTGKQTVQTYWMDVQEYQTYKKDNQYYLAAKYGGFDVPEGYTDDRTEALVESWWHTPSAVEADNWVGTGDAKQKRPNNFYTASRPDQVVKGLTAAFADIALKATTGYSSAIGTSQPQVSSTGNASFSASYSPERWSGDVVASELTFDKDQNGKPVLTPKWSFSDRLAVQANDDGWDTDRRIVTWDSVAGAAVAFREDTLSTEMKAALDTSFVANDDSGNYLEYLRGNRSKEITSGLNDVSRVYRERANLVGDINGSRVTVVAAPNLNLSDATNAGYSTFKSGKASRKRMLYVGANDGMLHAIDGALTGAKAGEEVFAYVPGALYQGPNGTPGVDGLAALGNPAYEHRNYVNATPYVMDVDFGKTHGNTGTDWRSVLVGGLGKGGKAYYAIDVSDPSAFTSEDAVKGKVLWEFSHADMGYSYGEPVIVKTKKYGWVVVLASGYNNADGKGYIFIVNPRTGALLAKLGTASDADGDAGLAHPTAYVLDRTDGYADAIYAGDLQGNVWRLDVSGTDDYAAMEKIATLTDKNGAGQPVTSRPHTAIDPATNLRYVLVGTGRYLDSTDINDSQEQAFYAFRDGNTAKFNLASDLPTGVNFPLSRSNLAKVTDVKEGVTLTATQLGWYLELGVGTNGAGKRVVTNPVSFLSTVAFSAFLPSAANPCSPAGTSQIFALDFGSGKTQLRSGDTVVTDIAVSGLVTDLAFFSVDGEVKLVWGNDQNETGVSDINKPGPGLKKLNWREITLTN